MIWKMTKTIFKRKLTIAAMIIAAIALSLRLLARFVRGFSDCYDALVTRWAVLTLGHLSDLVPFSVVELLIVLLVLALLISIGYGIVRLLRHRPMKSYLARAGSVFLFLLSLIFLLYEGGEDVYFYCTPMSERLGYGSGQYSTEELADVCRSLTARCNAEAPLVTREKHGIMISDQDLPSRAAEAMTKLGQSEPPLRGWYPRPKALTASILMSYTQMTGIYSAYTKEANYNRLMPPYNAAFTMCHELSHLRGVLPENEANFVAYLACRNSTDHDIVYSGALMGWIYCGNELYRRDKTLWNEIRGTLCDDVNRDLDYNTWYWKQYEGQAADAAQSFNDAYLKQAGQSLGVLSYDQVVDLIVSYETQQ